MDPVSAFASVVAIYQLASAVSSLCFRYGKALRGADRDADVVINEIDTFQRYLRALKDVLVDEDLKIDGSGRLQNLDKIINGESAVLKTCERDLESLKQKLDKVQSEGRFREAIHRISWPVRKEEVHKTLDTLKRFTEAVDRALNIDNNQIIRQVDSTTKRLESSLRVAESSEWNEKILDWLSHPDPSEVHEIVRRDRNDRAKTGRWFLDGGVFEKFKTTPQSVLWLHGDSGCGKSVLCSAVIDEILGVQSKDSRTKLAYWYFSVNDKTRTSVNTFLRALIVQLVFDRPIPPSLLDLWSVRKMGKEAPQTADLEQVVRSVLVSEPWYTYFIAIDALDESDDTERDVLVEFIRSLALLEVNIHILFTSRTNTVGIEKGMKGLICFYDFAVVARYSELDILAHVTERLKNDPALVKWSPDLRQLIKYTLITDARGMFRWVECQLQAVRKCRKPSEVRKILKMLPRDLHEVYARDLAKVDESGSEDIIRLLEWLTFSGRRLLLEEAVDMLAVDMEADHPAFDEENRMVDSEELVKIGGSLIRLDEIVDYQENSGHVAYVKALAVSHTSVIDFLMTQPVRIGSKRVYNFSRAKANLRMAETCLVYLRRFSENEITLSEDNIATDSFARWCASAWHRIYRELIASSEREDMSRLNGLILELFSSPTAKLNWLRLDDPEKDALCWLQEVVLIAEIPPVKPAIYYAASLGLPDIVKSLIEKGHPMDQDVGLPYGTPLVAACSRRRTDVAKLLLDSGADPNLSGYIHFGTPLSVACKRSGPVDIIRMLLSHGADPNISVWRHGPPLVVACLDGTLEIAELLVEGGAKLDKTSLAGHSALLTTALSPSSEWNLFEYLITKGADPFQEDKRGCNGLHYAARAKKGKFIEKMLDYGIGVNVTDRNGWSPLHWAVASTADSVEAVSLLLERECNKSLEDKQGRTALALAKTFKRQNEAAMLGGTPQTHLKSSDHTQSWARSNKHRYCDGCHVKRKYCKPESWHHCNDCPDFDFCFRCILDKDIIHFKDHSFSNEPA